ncbi:hypothetical protein ONS95_008306 [Cadophora gregata]|uniref:uncharacterized protein n=1 Tax=Cadophora gregata TaxID=51156 RepID=UPI0026DAFDD0|nr:uncharacterized protein ONS95_008306 [Cadophora gregata]KAK0100353.1 hypothetical protein ONS96_007633 [Cadophora gregata f. sp. sojae]KAK0126726.1 hypothetical protein ONS95_008306 [Cadophora gregata]
MTAKELSLTEQTLRLAQESVDQLKSKLDEVSTAKSKEAKAHLEETANLRAAAIDATAAHEKLTDELKMDIFQLHANMKEVTEHFAKEEAALADKISVLGAQLVESESRQAEDATKSEEKIADLQALIDIIQARFSEEKSSLTHKIETLQSDAKAASAAAYKEREALSNKLSAITIELETSDKVRDSLLQNSSQLVKNNDFYLEKLKALEQQLAKAEGVSSVTSVQLSQLEEKHAIISRENQDTKCRLEQVLQEYESSKQEVVILKQGYIQKAKSAEMQVLLDEIQGLKNAPQYQINAPETALLHTKILALQEARETEIAVISHLFDENSFLRSQVTTIQSSGQQVATDSGNATEQQVTELSRKMDIAVRQNGVFEAQLNEVKKLADFAQNQILRLEQEKKEDRDARKLDEIFHKVCNDSEKEEEIFADSKHDIKEQNRRLLSENDNLKILLNKEQSAHNCSQARLELAESTLHSLKDELETVRSDHESCRSKIQELTSAQINSRLLAARNDTQLEEISKLKDQLETREPLVQAGIHARRIRWEYAKGRMGFDGRWYDDRGTKNRAVIKSAQRMIRRPNFAADAALFFLGVLSSDEDRRMFNQTYHKRLCSDFHATVKSQQLAEIESMRTTLRDRCRIRAGFENVFEDSDEYKHLASLCYMKFKSMMTDAGLNDNSDKMKRKEVRDLFDADEQVQSVIERMREIYERAMRGFSYRWP